MAAWTGEKPPPENLVTMIPIPNQTYVGALTIRFLGGILYTSLKGLRGDIITDYFDPFLQETSLHGKLIANHFLLIPLSETVRHETFPKLTNMKAHRVQTSAIG